MGRPKGSKSKPGSKTPGPKAGHTAIERKLPTWTTARILDTKVKILELLSAGAAEVDGEVKPIRTVSDAARVLGIEPFRVWNWCKSDKDFQEYIKDAQEVIADDLESGFLAGRNDIPKMMLLKGIRPKYRDNFREEPVSTNFVQLIAELKQLGQEVKEINQNEPVELEPAPTKAT